MMGGIGMPHGHGLGLGMGGGLGLGGLFNGMREIRGLVEDRVGELKEDVESGRVDIAHLQNRLIERFGEDAAGIVGDDGTIDFDRLVEVITQYRAQEHDKSLGDRLVAIFGDDAEGLLGDDGTIDTEALRDLIVAKRTEAYEHFADRRVEQLRERVEAGEVDLEKLQERLTERFGDKAAGVVGEDGTVDYEAIKALIVDQRVTRLNERLDAYFAEGDGIDLDTLRDFIVSRKTEQYEKTADRLIERLQERVEAGEVDLEKLQERLTERYGEDAAGIVGIDGTIDYDAIKSLYVENRVERLQERLDERFDAEGAVEFDALRDFIVADRTERFVAVAGRIIDRLRQRVEAGDVDLENLQERLTDRFGEDAAGIVGVDGTVDYEAIKDLIVDRLVERLTDRLDGPVSDEGEVDGETLRGLIAEHRTKRFEAFVDRRLARLENRVEAGKVDLDQLQERLTARFGEDAAGIVGIDGIVDYDTLKTLIVDQFKERLEERLDERFGGDGDDETYALTRERFYGGAEFAHRGRRRGHHMHGNGYAFAFGRPFFDVRV